MLAREEERRRLRRDLHDGVGPALAALALQVETARDLAPSDPAAATELLDRLAPRLNAAVAEVRALVHELRPPTLDELGLAAAVRELATASPHRGTPCRHRRATTLQSCRPRSRWRRTGSPAEALANATRHAGARESTCGSPSEGRHAAGRGRRRRHGHARGRHAAGRRPRLHARAGRGARRPPRRLAAGRRWHGTVPSACCRRSRHDLSGCWSSTTTRSTARASPPRSPPCRAGGRGRGRRRRGGRRRVAASSRPTSW